MKTLVGTPDPEPQPIQQPMIWSGSNTSGWIAIHPASTITMTWTTSQ